MSTSSYALEKEHTEFPVPKYTTFSMGNLPRAWHDKATLLHSLGADGNTSHIYSIPGTALLHGR